MVQRGPLSENEAPEKCRTGARRPSGPGRLLLAFDDLCEKLLESSSCGWILQLGNRGINEAYSTSSNR
jgi:hypothetical protein